MFLAPVFVTREQFPNAVGQVFVDFVNLRYVIESLILAVIIISFHLLNKNRTSNTCDKAVCSSMKRCLQNKYNI